MRPPLSVVACLPLTASLGAAVQPAEQDGPEPVDETPPRIEVHALGEVTFLDTDQWVAAARRTPQPLKLAPAAVTVLDRPEFVYSPAVTIPDLLRYQAGIDVAQARHGQYEVGLRGFNSLNNPRTLALFDGRPFRFEQIGTPHWIGKLHPTDIERIEIVKGPASVTYGANAFGGVISIARRDWHQDPEARFQAQLGSDGYQDIDGTVATALGQSGWREAVRLKVSLGGSQRNDLPQAMGLPPGPDHPRIGRTGDDDLRSWRSDILLGIDLPGDHLLEIEWAHHDLREWDVVEDYTAGTDALTSDTDTISLRLRAPWGEVRHIRTYNDIFNSNQKPAYGADLVPPQADYWFFQAAFEDVWDQTRLQLNHAVGQHALIVGGEFQRFESESNMWEGRAVIDDPGSWGTITTENIAAFAEDQWLIDDRWALTAGLRYDDHSEVGGNLSPRLAVNFQQSPESFLRGSFSSGYRLPNSLEQHLESRFFASADDLEAETVASVDLGWQRVFTRQSMEVNLNLFYSRADDLITFVPIDEAEMAANWDAWVADLIAGNNPGLQFGPSHFFEYRNLDNPLHTYGIELGADWQPLADQDWTVWGNVTWNRARYEEDVVLQSDGFIASGPPSIGGGSRLFEFEENLGREVNAPPEWKINIGTVYRWKGLFVGAVGRFVDEREVFSIAYTFWNQDEIRTGTLEEYVALDLMVGYSWGPVQDPDGYVRFSAMNVVDASRHYEVYNPDENLLVRAQDMTYASSVGPQLTVTAVFNF